MPSLRHKRGTRAQIDAAAAGGGLLSGEVYLITDEARLTVGTAVNAHQATAKQGEGGGATYGTALINFGAFPGSTEATVSFSFAGVGTDVSARIASDASTVDYTAEDHKYAALFIALTAEPNPGVGGVIYARSQFGLQGTYAVRWAA